MAPVPPMMSPQTYADARAIWEQEEAERIRSTKEMLRNYSRQLLYRETRDAVMAAEHGPTDAQSDDRPSLEQQHESQVRRGLKGLVKVMPLELVV